MCGCEPTTQVAAVYMYPKQNISLLATQSASCPKGALHIQCARPSGPADMFLQELDGHCVRDPERMESTALDRALGRKDGISG